MQTNQKLYKFIQSLKFHSQVRFFRHYDPMPSEVQQNLKPCLAELNFGIALDSSLLAAGLIVVEKLQLEVNQTKICIHDGLYDFIRDANQFERANPLKTSRANGSVNIDELCQRISPIIPKQFVAKLENATFTAVKTNSPDDFSAKLKSFTVSTFLILFSLVI